VAGNVQWAAGGATNLSNANLTQTGGNRTYDLNGQDLSFDGTGSVGIGNNNPQSKLHVSGEVRSEGYANSNGVETEPSYAFTNDPDTGMWRGANTDFLRFSTDGTEAMTIDPSQNVGIGIAPAEMLHVAGNIRADGSFLSNDPTIGVPDHVFQKYFNNYSDLNREYRFRSLEEIEAFIKKNYHLPGIKSAAQVKEDGFWNLSDSNLKNLEKIEELFLHTIAQEKKIEQLTNEKDTLSQEVQALRKDIQEIKALLKANKSKK
jgi:hypothetical protein